MKFPSFSATGVLTMCLLSTSALASSTGNSSLTGNSGKTASQTCNTCHNGGTDPTVTITGPETLAVGATGQYTLTIQGGAAVRGGTNIALSAGTTASLEPSAELRKFGSELVHFQAKSFANNTVSFNFSVIAPSSAGSFTLYGAGNSANGSNNEQGDRAGFAQRVVTVTGGTGGGTDAGTGGPDAGTNTPGNGDDDDKGCSSTGGAPVLFALAAACMGLLRPRRS
ncbi:MAG TPA: MXAN_6652 family MXYO-CTERM-anchored protein [Myxococcus sp.]|nr:MXAN_6652 family MXYO-CTERM-anchored protein [Myxococcus sp.]